MKSHSISSNNLDEILKQIDETINTKFTPSLAIATVSVDTNIPSLIKYFKEKNIQLIGITSSGEIHNGNTLDKSMAILLLDMKEEYFKIITTPLNQQDEIEESNAVGKIARELYKDSSILVYTSGISTNGERVLQGLKKAGNHNIYGALAGDDLKMKESLVFTNDKTYSKGAILLVLDNDKYYINGGAYSGWESIGTEKTITKAIGNIVYEIDNRPALDVFKEYFGNNADLKSKTTEYPLQVMRDNIAVLRCPLVINEEEQSLTFAGTLFDGEIFKFCVPPDFDIIETTVNHFSNKSSANHSPIAVLLISCIARRLAFGPLLEDEVKGIYNIYKKPMIGLFSYGEIGVIEERESEFHNETCTLITINER